jgi:hypothetical protein
MWGLHESGLRRADVYITGAMSSVWFLMGAVKLEDSALSWSCGSWW